MKRERDLEPFRRPLAGREKSDVVRRLKSARGHLEHVIAMAEGDMLPVEVLQQLSAVRGAVEATMRVALRAYVSRSLVAAMRGGAQDAAVRELLAALAFLGPVP